MARHSACAKHDRASVRRNLRNRAAVSRLRTAVKKVEEAGAKGEASAALQEAYSVIDKSVKAGVLHRNAAANKKARLTRLVQKQAA
jgi:small subunit ribosomal protein S20